MAARWVSVPIGSVKPNPSNPRLIKDAKFRQLVQSVRDFPQMLELRPIVVDADGVVLGGNMRLKACKEAGLKQVPVIRADDLTPAQQREFVVKDNVGFGEWDWDALANEWDEQALIRWGLDVPTAAEEKEAYTSKIVAPTYEVTGDCPAIKDLFEDTKRNDLVAAIKAEPLLPADVRNFLYNAAQRHVVFDYQAIAEYYAHATPAVQRLMEASALVIIDFDAAIRGGFVRLSEQIHDTLVSDYGDQDADA
jgi:hypothetical protein